MRYNLDDPYYPHSSEDQVHGASSEPGQLPRASSVVEPEVEGSVPAGIALILQMLAGEDDSADQNNNV
jgi:hypothetical protein